LRGSDVVLSDKLLEHMSTAARRQLRGKRIDGSDLLEDVITRGLGKMKLASEKPARGEFKSFHAHLDIIVFHTTHSSAERAGIGYREGRTFFFTRDFAEELFERKKVLRPAGETYGYTKVLFLACYDAVVARCKRVIPEDFRHADLLALCMWKAYEGIFMNSFMERFGAP